MDAWETLKEVAPEHLGLMLAHEAEVCEQWAVELLALLDRLDRAFPGVRVEALDLIAAGLTG